MHRLSSNATLLLKFFIPVFWMVFFGATTLAALLYQYDYIGNTPAVYFKGGMVFFYVTGRAIVCLHPAAPQAGGSRCGLSICH